MPDVRKEVARPGTYTYLNPAGLPERLTVTADTIKHFHTQGKAMLADGLSIPVPLEHQPDAKVQTASERAAKQLLNNAGFVKDYEIVNVKDEKTGAHEDRLFTILDIPDAEISKKLPTTIRSVSPWINSFVDGNGKKWEGVISHVALTTRPRISKQAPFQSVGAAMSMLGNLGDKVFNPQQVAGGLSLPAAGLLTKIGSAFKPAHPIAFSLMTGIRLSEDSLKKIDEEEEADDEGDEEELDGEKPDAFKGGNTHDEVDDEESAGDVSFEELIVHLLEMHDIHVPAGGKGKEFLQALTRGLLASAKEKSKELEEPEGGVLGEPAGAGGKKPPGPVVQESPPMSGYMSMTAEQIAAITDPDKKQLAEAFLSLQTETQALRKNKLDEATATRQARIDRLLKRLPKTSHAKITAALTQPSAQLSLGADGIVKDPMTVMIEAFEAAIPDLPAMLVGGVKLSEQQQPKDGTITEERAKELADNLTRHEDRQKPKEVAA